MEIASYLLLGNGVYWTSICIVAVKQVVHFIRCVLVDTIFAEDNERNLAVAENRQFDCFLHETNLALVKSNIPVFGILNALDLDFLTSHYRNISTNIRKTLTIYS